MSYHDQEPSVSVNGHQVPFNDHRNVTGPHGALSLWYVSNGFAKILSSHSTEADALQSMYRSGGQIGWFICLRCGFGWAPRLKNFKPGVLPKRCARCRSDHWFTQPRHYRKYSGDVQESSHLSVAHVGPAAATNLPDAPRRQNQDHVRADPGRAGQAAFRRERSHGHAASPPERRPTPPGHL